MTKQAKLETFLKRQGVKVSPDKKKQRSSSRSPLSKQQKQARLQQCAGVLVLPTMGGGGARDEELQRLLSELDASRGDEVITQALRQLGCYEVTVEQLEVIPLGKRVKQLRQHSNPKVSQAAERQLAKMRADVTQACQRAERAKPIMAQLKRAAAKTAATHSGRKVAAGR